MREVVTWDALPREIQQLIMTNRAKTLYADALWKAYHFHSLYDPHRGRIVTYTAKGLTEICRRHGLKVSGKNDEKRHRIRQYLVREVDRKWAHSCQFWK